ncbi:hypothetical protein DPMN_097139 [Dreissena polymorpha]|uniref:Uncharacterized protein n=1 Tax=Dreissena polymorpha TaxID=45954 RepID=A0A9D4R4G3_DREPO|nr:hypothetical protein DPMN_097139 [Dreissena polymorpha]
MSPVRSLITGSVTGPIMSPVRSLITGQQSSVRPATDNTSQWSRRRTRSSIIGLFSYSSSNTSSLSRILIVAALKISVSSQPIHISTAQPIQISTLQEKAITSTLTKTIL